MLPATAELMSADDHIIEPPDLWVDRVLARFRDECPRIVEIDGRQAWLGQGELTYMFAEHTETNLRGLLGV